MSLVSNFVGGISAAQFGGSGKVSPDFDLNDTTFSDLLEKHLNTKPENETSGIAGMLGMPSGFPIENADFAEPEEMVKATNQVENQDISTEENDTTTSEMLTFYSSMLDNNLENQNSHTQIFDFARKQAANFYQKYSGNMVTDLQEFISDALHK